MCQKSLPPDRISGGRRRKKFFFPSLLLREEEGIVHVRTTGETSPKTQHSAMKNETWKEEGKERRRGGRRKRRAWIHKLSFAHFTRKTNLCCIRPRKPNWPRFFFFFAFFTLLLFFSPFSQLIGQKAVRSLYLQRKEMQFSHDERSDGWWSVVVCTEYIRKKSLSIWNLQPGLPGLGKKLM